MKLKQWITGSITAIGLVLVALAGAALWSAHRSERAVGLQVVRASNSLGKPFAIAIWYPTSARPLPTTLLGLTLVDVARDGPVQGERLPLVVLSHGNGGGPGSHVDLALALADAGYVVAAPAHAGDNFEDSSGLSSATFWTHRSHELRVTLDTLLNSWPGRGQLDPTRIGAFGFSAGGFTVLTAVGGQPDLRVIASHCATQPEFVCDVLRAGNSPLLKTSTETADGFAADRRIRAVVLVAPGLGFTFANGGLANVVVPVQIWSGAQDRVTPYASNCAIVLGELGGRVEARSVPGAGHTSFLAPCGLLRPPALCQDEDGFDRAGFHRQMNAEVVSFFNRALARDRP
jgi:predicted dienelactone hydrolase